MNLIISSHLLKLKVTESAELIRSRNVFSDTEEYLTVLVNA